MLRDIFKFLASLKLALILLAVIILASIRGTVLESDFNAEVARKYIYGASWFNLWLGMLCVNLFAVAAIRYPWKPHQTGFVITHAGIIILLIGGMIDRKWGMEGMIPLFRGNAPTDILELHEEDLVVRVDGKEARTRVVIKEIVWPSDFAAPIASPSPDVKVEIIDKYPPLAQLVLQGSMMGRHELWMFQNDVLPLGPATLRFAYGMPPEPKPQKPEAEKKMVPRSEWHFVYTKHEPMVHTMAGDATGADTALILDEKGQNPHLKLALFEKTFDIDVKPNIKKAYPLDGLAGWSLHIRDYFSNFKMVEGKPVNLSDEPENPTVIFELRGPMVELNEEDPDDPHGASRKKTPSSITLFLGPDGKLRYFMKTKKGEVAGDLEEGKPIPAFAPGSELIVQKFFRNGLTELMQKDSDALKGANFKSRADRAGGLLCKVSCGNESREVYLTEDNAKDFTPRKIEVGGKSVELALPHRYFELPFKIALERFDAPHEDGLDTMAAAYESTLSFQDKEGPFKEKQLDRVHFKPDSAALKAIGADRLNEKGDLICSITNITDIMLTIDLADLPSDRSTIDVPRAEIQDFTKRTHKIYMNHPTTYPQSWYAPWLGTNYKFSQAGQDARDPDYSGIQVLRDPGWMPKWVGCLMICFGIFTMFYLKPYMQGRREVKAAEARASAKVESIGKARQSEKVLK